MAFLDRFKHAVRDGGQTKNAAAGILAPAPDANPKPAASAAAMPVRHHAKHLAADTLGAGYLLSFQSPAKRAIEFEANTAVPPASAASAEGKHQIQLELGDFLPRIPKQLLHDGPHDPGTKLLFDIADLANRIAHGQTTIPLTEIHRRTPEIFREETLPSDETEVRFPWQKVVRMLAGACAAPTAAPRADGLTQAAAELLGEKLRNHRTVRDVNPGRIHISGTPHPVPPAPVSEAPVVKEEPATPAAEVRSVAPAVIRDMRVYAADGTIALSAMTAVTTLNFPLQDDDKLSREELLRSREAMRAQLARAKGEFERQLAAMAQERKNLAEERARFVAEMMRARADADDRIEQIEFERSVAAKTAENLALAQQAARALQQKFNALKKESAKAKEGEQRIRDVERDNIAQETRELAVRFAPSASVLATVEKTAAENTGLPAATEQLHQKKRVPLAGKLFSNANSVHLRSAWHVFATLAVCVVLAAALGKRHLRLRKLNDALSAEVLRVERESAVASAKLDDARRVEVRVLAASRKVRDLEQELDGDKWTAALRSIAVSTGAGIELRAIRAVRNPGDLRPCALQLDGLSIGPEPRANADQFRQALERELRKNFGSGEPCRFERLEVEPEMPSADPAQLRATFTITAPFGATVPPDRESHGKT